MNPETLYRLRTEIEAHFPSLGKWQAVGLALAVVGLILQEKCGIERIAEGLPGMGSVETVKKRLKRWLKNDRIALRPVCYDWIGWVWSVWGMPRAVLLVDETKLGNRIGVMMVSLAYGQRAIPLMWRCYRANDASGYPQQGQVLLIYGLLAHVLSVLPPEARPLVQMDRGLAHSSAMLRALKSLKVDFLVRVKGAKTRFTTRKRTFLVHQHAQPGQSARFHGQLFGRDHAVAGTLILIWELGQTEPWWLFTNVSRQLGQTYALRWWQEESFKDLKSGGWQWQGCQIACPRRMDRWLLVMAIAYAWMLSLGAAVHQLPSDQRTRIASHDERIRFSFFRLGLRCFHTWLYHSPHRLRAAFEFSPPAFSGFA